MESHVARIVRPSLGNATSSILIGFATWNRIAALRSLAWFRFSWLGSDIMLGFLRRLFGNSALQELKRQISGRGNPEYPFLDADYSPGSRVPCSDFVPFIADRLRSGDLPAIKTVMRGVLAANPGLGLGPSWIDARIDDVSQIGFSSFVDFDDEDAYFQLRALFIVAEKSGGGREFWLTEAIPQLFASVLCAYRPMWREPMHKLCRCANAFIRKMRKEGVTYWDDYPLFQKEDVVVSRAPDDEVKAKVRAMSPAARMHLLYAVFRLQPTESGKRRRAADLAKLTDYAIRSFGIHVPDTEREILSTGLVVQSKDSSALLDSMTKKQLVAACDEARVEFRKSWRKAKLLDALEVGAPAYVAELMADVHSIELNPDYSDKLIGLRDYAERLAVPFKVICFA